MRSATRDRPGTISFSSCRRLPARSRPKFDNPVIFPPGRAMLWTNFIPTGSGTNMNTIGIFVVASRKYGDASPFTICRLLASDDGNHLASVGPLSLRFSFHLQDVSSECVEFLFKSRLVECVVAIGPFQSDICPVLWPQRVKRGR